MAEDTELGQRVIATHAAIRPEDVTVTAAPPPVVEKTPPAKDDEESKALEVQLSQDAATRIVIQDYERGSAFVQEKWALLWRECDILYQSPRSLSAWAQPNMTRANVSRFVVARLVNSLVPKIIGALFYDKPPFDLRPRPGITSEMARGKKALINAYLDKDFKAEITLGAESQCLMGTGIFGWGVRTKTRKRTVARKREAAQSATTAVGKITVNTRGSDDWVIDQTTTTVTTPWLRHLAVDEVVTDPCWCRPDIRDESCKWVEVIRYLDFYEIEELREDPNYAIPETAKLKTMFFPAPVLGGTAEPPNSTEQMLSTSSTAAGGLVHAQPRYMDSSADPLLHKQMVIERWTNDKCYVVIRFNHHPDAPELIRGPGRGETNGENPFGVKPFYSATFWNVAKSGYGIGVGRINGQDQRIETGITNAALDIVSFACNPDYMTPRGANVPTQAIVSRLGGLIKVDIDAPNVKNAMVLKELPKVPGEAFSVLQITKAEEESSVGANEQFVQGGPGGARSSTGRTAFGASQIAGAVGTRIQTPLDKIIDNVMVPWIYQLDELIRCYVPAAEIREILGNELSAEDQALVKDKELEVVNAEFQYEVLAGAKLAARQAMAQALPLQIQLFEAPNFLQQLQTVSHITVDALELGRRMIDVSGWAGVKDVLRPMTPQEIQNMQAANQENVKLKNAMALQNQKQQGQSELLDQKTTNRAGEQVMKFLFEHAVEPEALTGGPGGQYDQAQA